MLLVGQDLSGKRSSQGNIVLDSVFSTYNRLLWLQRFGRWSSGFMSNIYFVCTYFFLLLKFKKKVLLFVDASYGNFYFQEIISSSSTSIVVYVSKCYYSTIFVLYFVMGICMIAKLRIIKIRFILYLLFPL